MSLSLKYIAGIAPIVTRNQYSGLLSKYEKTGEVPKRLKIVGMAVDGTLNLNKWQIAPVALKSVAEQLKDAQIRKDHSGSVDSIIGKINNTWQDGDQVYYEGEIADQDLIKKVLLGYVKYNSIQIGTQELLCRNCYVNRKLSAAEAKVASVDEPCPRCGSLEVYVEKPMVVEESLVATPAYPHAEIAPIGFMASLNKALEHRFTLSSTPQTKPVQTTVIKSQNEPEIILMAASICTMAAAYLNTVNAFIVLNRKR